MNTNEDPLALPRGITYGIIISMAIWAAVASIALIVVEIVR